MLYLRVLVLLGMASILPGQTLIVLKGEVRSQSPLFGTNYLAELYSSDSHNVVAREPIRGDGQFEFRQVTPGHYAVRICNQYGDVISMVTVSAVQEGMALLIDLPEIKSARPIDGVISASQLRRRVPKKAIQMMIAAQKYSEAGQFAKAAAKLEEALAIDPDLVDGHTNLGVQYMRLGSYDNAVREFQAAVRIGPDSALIRTNLAAGFIALRDPSQAESELRKALALDPGYVTAKNLLGKILAWRRR